MDYSDILLALGQVVVIGMASWTLGYLALKPWISFEHGVLGTAARMSTGLLVFSHAIFLLAFLHLISKQNIYLLGALTALMALAGIFKTVQAIERVRSESPVFWILLSLCVLYFAGVLLLASLPPIARDELIYHLEIPKRILQHGGFFQFLDNIYAYFPSLGEMLILFALAGGGELAAKFLHPLWGLILVLALYGVSRSYLSKPLSLLAVILFLSVPSVFVTMPLAYVDLTYAVYAFLALVAVVEFFKSGKLSRVVFAGVMIGAAISTKYTGLQFLLLMDCLIMVEYLLSRRRSSLAAILVMPAAAVLVSAPYFVRNIYFTGWPLFPFQIGELFRLNPAMNWSSNQAHMYVAWLNTFGIPIGEESIWHLLLAPILVFVRGQFELPQFYDGVLGPVFLLVPLLLYRAKLDSTLKWFSAFSILFLYYWVLTTKQIRFLFPVLPVLCLLLMIGLSRYRRAYWIHALAAILAGAGIVSGIREIQRHHPGAYWSGAQSREEYLAHNVESYLIYKKANESLTSSRRLFLINMKNYGYFLDKPFRSDFVFERWRLDQAMKTAQTEDQIAEFFRPMGITHLLIDERFLASQDWGFSPQQMALFRSFLGAYTDLLAQDRGMTFYRLR